MKIFVHKVGKLCVQAPRTREKGQRIIYYENTRALSLQNKKKCVNNKQLGKFFSSKPKTEKSY